MLSKLMAVIPIRDRHCLVLSAANADEAILVLEEHSEVDALFTDIEMPGSIDGLVLAGAARRSAGQPGDMLLRVIGNPTPRLVA